MKFYKITDSVIKKWLAITVATGAICAIGGFMGAKLLFNPPEVTASSVTSTIEETEIFMKGREAGLYIGKKVGYAAGMVAGKKAAVESAELKHINADGSYELRFFGSDSVIRYCSPSALTIDYDGYEITGYCACSKCCGSYANGITSTGKTAVSNHTIAVDPKVIPYGSKVVYNGITYTAEDCGAVIKGRRIDIYFDTHQEALDFGRQKNQTISIIY